jgi:hypothetical protein
MNKNQILFSSGFGFFLETPYASRAAGLASHQLSDVTRPKILCYHDVTHFIVLWERDGTTNKNFPILYKCKIGPDGFVFDFSNYTEVDEYDIAAGYTVQWYYNTINTSN